MSQSGAHQSATFQKGVKSCQKGGLPKLSRDGPVYPRASIPKRGTWSHPTFDHSRSPAIHSRKKEKTGCLGGAQGARQTLQMLILSRFDGEHGHRRRQKALSPFLSRFFFFGGGVYPFLSNAVFFILGLRCFCKYVLVICSGALIFVTW